MTDFEVGDRVRLLSASYGTAVKGDEGKVTAWGYGHELVHVLTDHGATLVAYPHRFEKVVAPTFKPGDKVRWKDGRRDKAIVKVIEPVHEPAVLSRTWTDYCGGTHTATADLELVEAFKPSNVSTKFKVGDRIRPKDGQEYNGKFEATVVAPKPGDHRTGEVAWPYSIRLDDSSLLSCVREDEIELVPAVTHAFKVGDKVVYKREPNVVYTILKLGERSDHYYISWISTFTGDHTKGEYELDNGNYKVVPEAPKLTRAKRQETALLKLHTELWDSRGTVIDDPDGFGYGDLRYKVLTGAIDSVVLALDALREEK